MFTALVGWIKSLFEDKSYQDSVEYFVASKHPQTTSEVEYWIRHYEQQQKNGWAPVSYTHLTLPTNREV